MTMLLVQNRHISLYLMKISHFSTCFHKGTHLALLVVLLLTVHLPIEAQGSDELRFDYRPKKVKLETGDTTSTGVTKVKQETWVYEVTVTNRSFDDLEDLVVKHRAYVKDARTDKLIPSAGEATIARLDNNDEVIIQTEPSAVEKTQLDGGWVYTDGSNPRQYDRLYGLWIRIYKDGELVSEFTTPASLERKVSWD